MGSVRREDAGQSLVEFALVMPVLMMSILGLVEFAFAFNSRDSVYFAARDASTATPGPAIGGRRQ